jgi:cytochrome c553
MQPLVRNLSGQDMQNLAAYYAYLPRPPEPPRRPAPAIVISGAPMRGIAPCGSCHGNIDHKIGSPWLDGESIAYLRDQLIAFKNGTRHNDTGAQMRNIARAMTNEEIEQAARYYGVQP